MNTVKPNDEKDFYSYRDKIKSPDIQPILYLDNGLTLYNEKTDSISGYNKLMYDNKIDTKTISEEKSKKFLDKYDNKNMKHYNFNKDYMHDNTNESLNNKEIFKLTKEMKNNNNYILKFLTDIKGNHNVTIKILDNEKDELSENEIQSLSNLDDIESEQDFYDLEEPDDIAKCPKFKKKTCWMGHNLLYFNKDKIGTTCPYIVCNEHYFMNYLLLILMFIVFVLIVYYINIKN
tara:strand:- start:2760 stop:3458 length:699 start_codon:yes stop_codon:yes gene_type:complete